MPSLAAFPNEILDTILSEVPSHDLASLAQTCRRLRSSATPWTYRHVTIQWDDWTTGNRSPKPIYCLLRTILENPSLSNHVKSLHLFTRHYTVARVCDDDRAAATSHVIQHLIPDGDKESALLEKAILELRLPRAGEWITAITKAHYCDQAAAACLLLAQCTELESLTVDFDFVQQGGRWLTTILRHGSKNAIRPALDKLTHFTVSTGFVRTPKIIPDELLMLPLYLPSLKSLDLARTSCIYQWNHETQTRDFFEWPYAKAPVAASLTRLDLRCSQSSMRTVEALLERMPSLESLYLDFQPPETKRIQNLHRLRQGLDHVRHTLSRLTIRFKIVFFQFYDFDELGVYGARWFLFGYLKPLRDLISLRELEIPLFILYGGGRERDVADLSPLAEVLPPNLERLTFSYNTWDRQRFQGWPDQPITSLLTAYLCESWKTATPNLREFRLDIQERAKRFFSNETGTEYEDEVKPDIERIQQICEEQGLRCTILDGDENYSKHVTKVEYYEKHRKHSFFA